jgi:colanic acid biosynthesis glycosyl transferase WcaI
MAVALAAAGHQVEVIAARPYYPDWRVPAAFRNRHARTTEENGVRVRRVAIYVPRNAGGMRRILHHLSFAAAALLPMLRSVCRQHPDIIMTIAPSMIAAPVARWAARLAGAKSWLHIQDLEVGAAVATGLIGAGGFTGWLASRVERFAYSGFHQYSSISPQMCARLAETGIPSEKITEFRNWSDVQTIHPLTRPSAYRAEWGITAAHVALYSGNIGNKQGIEIVVHAARLLRGRSDLLFVVCGEGPRRAALVHAAAGLPNIRFEPLQPRERLGELMGLATVHLLPQLPDAADLVLPSKLTNMLASGRPVVATAAPGTGLALEVEGCGAVVPPGDPQAFAAAIALLLDDPGSLATAGIEARVRAEERWSKRAILSRLDELIRDLAVSP